MDGLMRKIIRVAAVISVLAATIALLGISTPFTQALDITALVLGLVITFLI